MQKMAQNPQAYLRYRVIDKCLQNQHRIWDYESLAQACDEAVYELEGARNGFSRSTIMRDLRIMKSEPPLGYGAPIKWDRQRKSYAYTEKDFSILKSPITETDQKHLKQAIDILRQIPHLEDVAPWYQLSTKLQDLLRVQSQEKSVIIQFDSAPNTDALKWLPPLYKAIDGKTALTIYYRPFSENKNKYSISPWLLKQYNRRWFLIAWNHDLEMQRIFALDRIEQINLNKNQGWHIQEGFDPNNHFKDLIGLSIYGEPKPSVIQFKASALRAKYINTKPLHPSQRIVESNDSYTIFELRVIINIELQQILLSFGPEIEVLSPPEFRLTMATNIREAAQLYNGE